MQTKEIKIGETKFGKPVYFKIRDYGDTLILGRHRYGKTTIAKTIVCGASDIRPVIIISPAFSQDYDDWYGLKYLNRNAEIKNCISFLKCINNFSIKLSRFKDYDDWISLGFPDMASQYLKKLAPLKKVHNDDPNKFLKLLEELPRENIKIKEFNELHGIYLSARIDSNTYASLINRFQFLAESEFFWYPNDTRHPVKDFKEIFILNPHVLIDLEDNDEVKARAYVGVILKDLHSLLSKIRPMLVIDEADKVAPESDDFLKFPSSLRQLIDYKHKYQKLGVNMILLTQEPKLLYQKLRINPDFIISGQIEPNIIPELTKELIDKLFMPDVFEVNGFYFQKTTQNTLLESF